jgi:hypothetical protein
MDRRRAVVLPVLLAGLACADEPQQAVALVSTHEPFEPRSADVLLVLDDSPSMRPFTANGDLAAQLGSFAEFIDVERGNIRVAITTTSVPGPTCTGALARGGELLTETCAGLPDQAFVGPGELEAEVLDLRSACAEACPRAQLGLRLSPSDDLERDLAIRPWIEARHNSYGGNLPNDLSLAEALTCVGMRGFGGCEHESPIAAAMAALERMQDPGDLAYGFLRDDVPLLIVFLGNEDDCSHPDSSATIFDPAGEGVFWTDPSGPTSGVCHRAATACDEQGCVVIDRELGGEPTDDPTRAVLTPLSSFRVSLEALESEREVAVSLLGGVRSNGALSWPPDGTPEQVEHFGWGPGCTGPGGRLAQPPGRLYELVTDSWAFSICDDDWSGVLLPIVDNFVAWLRPWYPPKGTADADPELPGLQPDCVIRIRLRNGERIPMAQCLRDEQGWVRDQDVDRYALPEGAEACWYWLFDPGGLTDDPHDDLPPEAVEAGHSAQLGYRVETFFPRGSRFEAVCVPEG